MATYDNILDTFKASFSEAINVCGNPNCSLCYPYGREGYYDRASTLTHPYYPSCDWGLQEKLDKRKPLKRMTLSNLAKKLLDADTKVLVKAGVLDSELEVTRKGKKIIFAHYLNANKKELAQEARKLLKEEKEDEE